MAPSPDGPRKPAQTQVIPLEAGALPEANPKNLDAYLPDAPPVTKVHFDAVDAAPGKTPGKVSTFATWAKNVATGKSWVMDLNVISTNRCTQTCPMCNSYVLAQTNRSMLTVEQFRGYLDKLAPYRVASCTISGGEPTIVPDMPQILIEAQKSFPFGVTMISNFYGNTKRIMRVMDTALKLGIRISCSFDGFGEAADKQRGARNVAEHVLAHLRMVLEHKRELGVDTSVTLHTVLSDDNVAQYPQILELVKELGLRHTVAPVNDFGYEAANLSEGEAMPTKLSPSPELEQAVEAALASPNLVQSHAYVKGILPYITRDGFEKVCPYLTPGLKSLKLFIEPNGDISVCDRQPIGNLNEDTLEEIFESDAYQRTVEQSLEPCPGCWLTCFVEMPLSIKPKTIASLDFLHRKAPKGL
ncbi:MAG: radical SAM protein [Dehalococcoidia bacterium]